MFTFSLVKKCAHNLNKDGLLSGKEFAVRYQLFGLWWAYEAAENYQYFLELEDKLFWWRMTVRTLRHANSFQRFEVM